MGLLLRVRHVRFSKIANLQVHYSRHSGGILPIPSLRQLDNWTIVKAVQQGFTANVTCRYTPDFGPAFSSHNITDKSVLSGFQAPYIESSFSSYVPPSYLYSYAPAPYTEYSICCNCTTGTTRVSGQGGLLSYDILSSSPLTVSALGPSIIGVDDSRLIPTAFTICPYQNITDDFISAYSCTVF